MHVLENSTDATLDSRLCNNLPSFGGVEVRRVCEISMYGVDIVRCEIIFILGPPATIPKAL